MTQAQSPLAVRQEGDLAPAPTIEARAIGGFGMERIERVEKVVALPAAFQYVIPGRKKIDGQWVDDNKVGITSDGYDYINRTLGVTFWLPDLVPNEVGEMVRNPIHRPDYIYLRMGGLWRNESGQLVALTEDLEVDYEAIYANARLEAAGSEVMLDDKTGMPIFDERGRPRVIIRDVTYDNNERGKGKTVTAAEQEKKALKALYQLRTMGLRYAQTVLRTRITKVALGVKSLPIQQPREFRLLVVGWRDSLTPDERFKKAEQAMGTLFGGVATRPADAKPLTAEELHAIEPADVDTSVDRTVMEATGVADDPFAEPEQQPEQQPEQPEQDEFAFSER